MNMQKLWTDRRDDREMNIREQRERNIQKERDEYGKRNEMKIKTSKDE